MAEEYDIATAKAVSEDTITEEQVAEGRAQAQAFIDAIKVLENSLRAQGVMVAATMAVTFVRIEGEDTQFNTLATFPNSEAEDLEVDVRTLQALADTGRQFSESMFWSLMPDEVKEQARKMMSEALLTPQDGELDLLKTFGKGQGPLL